MAGEEQLVDVRALAEEYDATWPADTRNDAAILAREHLRVLDAIADVRSLAEAQARSCQAQHRADHARNWLDVLALLDRVDGGEARDV